MSTEIWRRVSPYFCAAFENEKYFKMNEEKNKSLSQEILKTVIAGILLSSITWLGYNYIGKKIEKSEIVEKEKLPVENINETKQSDVEPAKEDFKEVVNAPKKPYPNIEQASKAPPEIENLNALAKSKKLLSGINNIFTKWSDTEWSFDSYIDESVNIEDITKSEINDNSYTIFGDFNVYRRFQGRVNVAFYSKISIDHNQVIVERVCYKDKSINDEKCCSPKKWSLARINK
jgi:hypothetical protein